MNDKLLAILRSLGNLHNRLRFDNRKFWNDRYSTDITRGSGPGSRGANLELKNEIIRKMIKHNEINSVLDIGCGDIEILNGIQIDKYTGIDISQVVTTRNKTIRPNWDFICVDMATDFEPEPADLVLCLDVLIHQKRKNSYDAILAKAIRATKIFLLISGYSSRPNGWNIWFHEPLETSLRHIAGNARLLKVADYRELELWKVSFGDN